MHFWKGVLLKSHQFQKLEYIFHSFVLFFSSQNLSCASVSGILSSQCVCACLGSQITNNTFLKTNFYSLNSISKFLLYLFLERVEGGGEKH